MKKAFSIIIFLSVSAIVQASEYRRNEPFQLKSTVIHYYGREKSAEAGLWHQAFAICDELGDLLVNRLSEVIYIEDQKNSQTHAKATFICVQPGSGG